MTPSVVILTFNSIESLPATLERALRLTDDVFVVDSFSTDATVSIAESLGATVVQHAFENYGLQRNWAIDSLPFRYPWQLHLDADECMNERLVEAIHTLPEETPHTGFLIARYIRFLGRTLKHGAMSPTWHLRLFRSGGARCEERKYDQHFYLTHGTTGVLRGHMTDDICMSLSEWTTRHNRWSDAVAAEKAIKSSGHMVQPRMFGNAIERKRYWQATYNKAPLFLRPFALFGYRYFVRLGFLDGLEGFLFWILQTFWFQFLIDAKIFELRKRGPSSTSRVTIPLPVTTIEP